jgi:hypothetical protein
MLQFIPFDDRWFDADELPPGPLVPYHVGMACVRPCPDDRDHWLPGGKLTNVTASPPRKPSFAATPAFSSST